MNSVIPRNKQQGEITPKHHGIQRYCTLCKKAGITEKNYMLHCSENVLANVPTSSPSRKDWEDPYTIGMMLSSSTKSLNTNGENISNLSISSIKCYT